jgi:hypothetical protein
MSQKVEVKSKEKECLHKKDMQIRGSALNELKEREKEKQIIKEITE